MPTGEETPAWERSKENAAPLARGRNVKVFEKSTVMHASERLEKERMISHYEGLVAPSEDTKSSKNEGNGDNDGDNNDNYDDDPLIHWLSYIKYHQDAFPSDTHTQFLLMERCTRALIKRRRYANDVRFIRACVLYADKTDYPGDVFKFLHQNKVGSKIALFWIAWAWVAENKGDFAFAEKVFLKGINKDAQPIKMLKTRHKQFQRRMSRHWLNTTAQQEEQEDNQQDAAKRKTFGKLSEKGIQRNDRAHKPSVQRHDRSLSAFSSRARDPKDQRSDNNQQSGGFQIFVEDNATTEQRNDDYILEHSGIENKNLVLETQAEKKKENLRQAERWNERGGYSAQYNTRSKLEVAQVKQASFPVHVDEDCIREHQKQRDDFQQIYEKGGRKTEGRAFRDRDEGVAGKLARDPMRYIVNPNKFEKDKPILQTKQNAVEDTKGKVSNICGFDKRLVAKDSTGADCCFEEARLSARYFTLASTTTDFNLLQNEESEMDIGEETASIEEIEMDDDAESVQASIISKQSTRSQGKSRRVLFSVDQYNQSFANASVASSTVNEREAVGAPTEETINTKYAMKELSMMFSSPAMGLNDSCATLKATESSMMKDLVGDDDKCDVNNSIVGGSVMEDEKRASQFQIYSETPEGKSTLFVDNKLVSTKTEATLPKNGAGFGIFCDEDETSKVEQPVKKRKQTTSDKSKAGGFGIFCDDDKEEFQKSNESTGPDISAAAFDIFQEDDTVTLRRRSRLSKSRKSVVESPGGFQIFNDQEGHSFEKGESVNEKEDAMFQDTDSLPEGPPPPPRPPFTLRSDSEDESDTDSDDDSTELTQETQGTLALLHDVLGDVADAAPKQSKSVPRPGLSIYTDDTSTSDDFRKYKERDAAGVVSVGEEGFGDVSKIDMESSQFQCSPTGTDPFVPPFGKAVDYANLHDNDIRLSVRELRQEASGDTRAIPFERRSTDLAILLSTEGKIIDLPNQAMPRALKRKKATIQGEQVMVGSSSGLIRTELGRGSYAVVVLLSSHDKGNDEVIAVKAQSPIDCLAWEYVVMRRLHTRLESSKHHPSPFPSPLSFVSLDDGALLGMTAASNNGRNLVDLVNLYRSAEGGQVPELIALHYTARMLHHIEMLHWKGNILHCDVKPDNWVMMDSKHAFEGCKDYINASDLMLVDFGRAVDLRSATSNEMNPLDVVLTGQATTDDMACVSMRKNLGWSFDVDTFGVCASAHVLLYGEHMKIECKAGKKWMIQKRFPRYWQKHLWADFFQTLLNLDEISKTGLGSRPRALRQLRGKFIEYLSPRAEKLGSLLRRQSHMLRNV